MPSGHLFDQILSVHCSGRQHLLCTEEGCVEVPAQDAVFLLPVAELARDDGDDDDDDDDDSQDDKQDDEEHGAVVALVVTCRLARLNCK